MKSLTLVIFILSLLTTSALADDAAEVQAARAAAAKHNESIQAVEARLEREIERAKEAHAKAVITAKERMIEDLRRAFRVAMRSDAPENSIKIADQIKRLEKQVEQLKNRTNNDVSEKDKPVVEVELKGLDPRLVGVLYLQHPAGNHGRAYAISPKGEVRVLYHLAKDETPHDLGSLYQGKVVGDEFVVHFTDWTYKGYKKRSVKAIKIEDGLIKGRGARYEDFQRNFFNRFSHNYNDSYFQSVDDFKKYLKEDTDNDVAQDAAEENPNTEDPDDAVDVRDEAGGDGEVDSETVDFFGIPVK